MAGGQTPEKRADYNRQYKAIPANMEKVRARDAVYRALRYGRMSRLPCENCGEVKTHAHHEDYAKPLDIRWLCQPCHVAEHHHDAKAPNARASKTHCINGHALTDENIYRVGNKRICKACHLKRERGYYRKRRSHDACNSKLGRSYP